uniref:Cytochrome P450 96A57 n=1 Tax=Isatis tinctoria TaxID=161756 RepID=A0A8F0K7A9_ISATI|nr:cytochrome P450 96A57 [Isatis tinctoria]
MLPGVLVRLNRIYDCSVEVFENSNLTFSFKGPWFAGMDTLTTVDPINIHHIMSSNFSNYIKGPEFQEVFDVFGDGFINVDSDIWKNLRKSSQIMFNHQGFQRLSMNTARSKIKDGIFPLFDQFSEEGRILDLQDVFERFMLDTTFILVTGSDPRSLATDTPKADFAKALDDVGEVLLYRHITPRFLWKLQKWMGIGKERMMIEASATLDRVCAEYISTKRKEIRSQETYADQSNGEDIITSYIKLDTTKYKFLNTGDDKFLRDMIVNLSIGGKESTATALTWFFWLLIENPKVVTKIHQEMNTNLPKSESNKERLSIGNIEYLNKLDYMHGALYEAMRLYPPAPFERKSPIKQDVLPSGHKVKANSRIMIFTYALGRMKSVWGEDAMEFKPERWISESGGLRHEPAFKFFSFNAGPRTCLGKNLAMNLMKIVVVEVLQNYDFKIVHGQKIEPVPGLTLHMRHGLRVTVSKK